MCACACPVHTVFISNLTYTIVTVGNCDCAKNEKNYLVTRFNSVTEKSESLLLVHKKASEKQQPTETSVVIYLKLKGIRTKS